MFSGCLGVAELGKMKKFWRRMRVTVTHGVDAPSTAEPWLRWVTHGVDAPSTAEPWWRWSAFGQVGDRGPLGAPGDGRRGADGIKITLARCVWSGWDQWLSCQGLPVSAWPAFSTAAETEGAAGHPTPASGWCLGPPTPCPGDRPLPAPLPPPGNQAAPFRW